MIQIELVGCTISDVTRTNGDNSIVTIDVPTPHGPHYTFKAPCPSIDVQDGDPVQVTVGYNIE